MREEFYDEILTDVPKYTLRDKNGKIINDDVDISLKTPVLQEGTPLNKKLFGDLFGMNNCELMELVQEDLTEEVTASKVRGQLTTANNGYTIWTGNCIGIQNRNPYPFTISCNKLYLQHDNSYTVTDYVSVYPTVDGENEQGMSDVNQILSRTTNSPSYYLNFRGRSATEVYLEWDLLRDCMPTFNCNMTYAGDSASFYATGKFEARKDGSDEWVQISVISSSTDYSIDLTKNYRYYRIKIALNGTEYKYSMARIYYAYFDNVPDVVSKYINNFTVNNNFAVQNIKNVIVPTHDNVGYIIENTVNGIQLDTILTPEQRVTLEYFQNVLTPKSNINIIRSGSVSLTAFGKESIECPEANMAFVYTGFTNEITHWYPLFRDGKSTTGYTGSTTSTSVKSTFSEDGVLTIELGSDASSRTINYVFI